MEDAREARRKRLVNRGTDRLAFITGQARSLPQNPSSPTDASLPEDAIGSATPKYPASDQTSSSKVETDDRKELPLPSRAPPKFENSNENEISKCETTSNESVKLETNNYTVEKPSTTSVVHRSSDQVDHRAPRIAPKISYRNLTPSQINGSFSATRNIRLLCSVVIALSVILSHHGYPLGGKLVGGIISFRPLFLVLLTDATVIFGSLLVNQEAEHKGEGEGTSAGQGEYDWTNDVGKMLEAAMLFQKALGSAFMDCSVCAVIIICGIGF